jgi:uncharacterized membrane protein YfcA
MGKTCQKRKPLKSAAVKRGLLSVAGGLGVGFLNGVFGGGGGMLCVPLLEKGLKEKTKTAHATAILIILPICIVSAVLYGLGGNIPWQAALYTAIGVFAGGILGAKLLKKLPEKAVGIVFAALMIAAGIMMTVR